MERRTNFVVIFFLDGKRYAFNGRDIDRKTADGAGQQILYAPCWEERINEELDTVEIVGHGVVNLNPDWSIRSLYMQ